MKKRTVLLVLLAFAFGACGGGGGGGGDATNGSTPVTNVSSATSISTNVATLNGNVNPNGLATNAWFEWGTDSALSTPTSTPPQSIGSGLIIVPVSLQITGLAENTKYYFRVCGSNSKGESESAITSFTTSSPGAAPAATTLAAISVGGSTATLNGNVNPNGLATNAWFEWGTDPSLVSPTSTSSQSVGSGTTSQLVIAALTGLTTGTKYYYRVAASNATGTTKGSILSFTPGGVPAVTTLAATSVGANTATLNGNVTANGLATNAWFEWGTDSTLTTSTSTSSQSVGSGTTSVSVNAALTGLTTGTKYYYRVAASNATGTTMGSILSFTPGVAPVVTTLAATSVDANNATLNGNVTANGLATNAWFEWGTDSTLTTSTSTSSQSVGSGTTSVSVNAALTGLTTGTKYYYRVVASNATGTTIGSILSFTPGGVPAVTTLAATSVGVNTATLNGNVTANGLATNAWFEWGTDPSLASPTSTSSQAVGSGITSVSVNAALTGLTTGTTYYYRNAASNSLGTTKGEILSFKTTNEISGIINTNTTLSISNSPYYFNNVQLDYGATITIEPGVVINGGSIQVWGNLNAIGSISSKIFFNGVSIKPGTSNSGKPFSINIQFAEVNGGQFYYPTGYGIYGNLTMRDSIINNIGWMYLSYPTSDCYIERNIINGARIDLMSNNPVMLYIRNNVFYNTSITSVGNVPPSGAVVLYNSFLSGVTLNIKPGYLYSYLDAIENYWNTTDTSVIDSMIYDRKDDLNCADYIEYLPILSSPHPNTPIP